LQLNDNLHRCKSDADSDTYSRQACYKNIFRDAVFRLTARTPIGAGNEEMPNFIGFVLLVNYGDACEVLRCSGFFDFGLKGE
jgi:hypothetical protein